MAVPTGSHGALAVSGLRRIAMAGGVALGLAGCGHTPTPSASLPPPTTSSPATSAPTTTLFTGTLPNGSPAMGPGKATLSGTVQGPAGAVAGATVEVQRLVGGAAAQVTLTSHADGTWQLPGILGGRFSVRAWLAPDLAQSSPTTLFLADDGNSVVTLQMVSFSAPLVQSAVAPDPAVVAEPSQIVVEVDSQLVQGDGTVATEPDAGLLVQLVSSGAWSITSPNPTATDGTGDATWTATCTATGSQPLQVQLGAAPAPATFPATTGTTAFGSPSTGSGSTSSSSTNTTTTIFSGSPPATAVAPQLVTLNAPFCMSQLPPATATTTITTTTTTPAPTSTSSTTTAPGPGGG